MKDVSKIAFLLEEFPLESPSQQLLDRFLFGFQRDGEFYRPAVGQIHAQLLDGSRSDELNRRVEDHGLLLTGDPDAAVAEADGVIVVPRGGGANPNDRRIQGALRSAPPGSACFVYGALGSDLPAARAHAELARERKLGLLAGTPWCTTWRLPEVDLPLGAALNEALIIVQGEAPQAEWEGFDALLPTLRRRRGGEAGVKAVRYIAGDAFWAAGKEGAWSWALLAAALSRSDTPQGDAVADGRTQDLVGLGYVPKLARKPRGWLIEHRDGVRSTVLVLDGVIADYCFALKTSDGSMISAQLYQPPKPAQHQFSRLARVVDDFFHGAAAPWPIEQSVLSAGLLARIKVSSTQAGQRWETPEL